MTTDEFALSLSPDVAAGAAVYSRFVLALYDLEVLGFELPVIFKCPARRIVEHYDRNVSGLHLDVGVGTGYFLDRCTFPVPKPEVHLLDLNPNCLARTARRIRRYQPVPHRGNVLEPIRERLPRFRSIALSNLLHCLPGNLARKSAVFGHLRPQLRDDGVLFGVTVLGKGVDHVGALFRTVNRAYNRRAIFSNLDDGVTDLEAALAPHFSRFTVKVVGAMAFFSARP